MNLDQTIDHLQAIRRDSGKGDQTVGFYDYRRGFVEVKYPHQDKVEIEHNGLEIGEEIVVL